MSAPALSRTVQLSAARIVLRGHVQGIGVRPAVARLAALQNLAGRVTNQTGGVEIHVEGPAADVAAFQQRLPEMLPAAAIVEQIVSSPAMLMHAGEFRIDIDATGGALSTHVPRDLAVCNRCLCEVATAADRRYGYPLTSCTDCGPRYSVIETMPYERAGTAMRDYPLCEQCAREFGGSADRRFHAQTTACSRCGPSLWSTAGRSQVTLLGAAAIEAAVVRVLKGDIIAIKGIGGYQLLCDATSREAVRRLRTVKQRRSKPFAVMLDELHLRSLPESDLAAFESSSNPIVIVPSECVVPVDAEVSPGLATIGVMQPSSPLHWSLLQQAGRPLVITSGNTVGRPLAFENAAAEEDLSPHTGLLLHHDRRIVRPVDDSVVRVIKDRTVTIRCGRGLAPLPLALSGARPMLAVGGHLKVAVALCNGQQSVLGPHIGDLDSLSLRERFVEQTRQLVELYGVEPELIAHDMHPDYFTMRWAQEQGLPTVGVQHHHAHVVAGMLEHNWLDGSVLGVAFDGTGWGPDGTIWGGEFLLARSDRFQRVGSLLPFLLPGGEQAIRQPWRVAVALLSEACGLEVAVQTMRQWVAPKQSQPVLQLIRRGIGPRTSSMGRLFDAISAMILDVRESSHEGEPAMALEAACDSTATGEYPLPVRSTASGVHLDWRPLLQELRKDLVRGAPTGVMSMRFHRAIAAGVARMAGRQPELPVVLSGGCFQNRVLCELTAERLAGRSQPVGLPGVIPPNDGGLAVGQLAVAQARHRQRFTDPDRMVPSCA